MPTKTHSAIALSFLLLCSGCVYPVYKTLQPDVNIRVTDAANQPVADASVYLKTTVHPSGVVVSVLNQATNPDGKASFAGRNEWRAETTMLHGATDFSWSVCIEKPSYQTFMIPKAEETEAMASVSVTLEHGVSAPCPQ